VWLFDKDVRRLVGSKRMTSQKDIKNSINLCFILAIKYYNDVIEYDGISKGSSKLKKYENIFHIQRTVHRDIFL